MNTESMQFSPEAEDMHAAASEHDEHQDCPGSGDGSDDFADYNANEADDYRYEGAEDSYLDASYEDRTECDFPED